jgi:hypothetical protein
MPLGPIEYLESRHHLYPMQRFILKLVYGVPLDREFFSMEVRNPYSSGGPVYMTENGYWNYLWRNGRCNQSGEDPDPNGYHRVLLAMGRRSGKGQLVALMLAYEVYLALEQDRSTMTTVSLSQSVEMSHATQQRTRDILSRDRVITRESRNSLGFSMGASEGSFRFFDAHSRTLMGVSLDFFSMHDVPFMRNPGGAWAAYSPLFSDNTRVVLESTPNGAGDFFHGSYVDAGLEWRAQPPWLTLRIPTWDANPLLSDDFFAEERQRAPSLFGQEYGADFVDRSTPNTILPAGTGNGGAVTISSGTATSGTGGTLLINGANGPEWQVIDPTIDDESYSALSASDLSSLMGDPELIGPTRTRFQLIEALHALFD